MGRRAGLSTDEVIERAAALADAEGLDALTITHLAAQLGVKPPSLYNHIGGLEALQIELALRGGDEITRRLRAAADGAEPEDAVRAMCHEYRGFARDHPGLYAAHSRGTRLTQDDEHLARIRAPIPVVAEVFLAFGLDRRDTIHAIRSFRGTVHGFIQLEDEAAFQMGEDVDESFDRAVEIFVAGLAGWR